MLPGKISFAIFATSNEFIIETEQGLSTQFTLPANPSKVNLSLNYMKYGEQSQIIQFNNTGILASMGYQSNPHEPWQYALILMKCLLKINNIEHDYNRFIGTYDEIDHFYTASMTKITCDHFYNTLIAHWYNNNVPDQITECGFEDFDTIINTIDEYKVLYNYLTLYLQ
jgi:hypothetical protein